MMIRGKIGQTIIIIPLLVLVLIAAVGLTFDIGNVLLAKNKLQAAADAAALAGAKSLYGGLPLVRITVSDFVVRNGLATNNITIVTPYNGDPNRIRIIIQNNTNYYFMRVLGKSSVSISASSAALGVKTGYHGCNALAMPEGTFTLGNRYEIKSSAGEVHSNHGAIALGGPGADQYRDNLSTGYQGPPLSIGDVIRTEPGQLKGPTATGFDARFNAGFPGESWNNYTLGNPRVVLVMLVDPNPYTISGSGEVTVRSFALFFLENYDHSDGSLDGTYIGNADSSLLGGSQTPKVDVSLIE
ncbi:MAG: pilus assembly protein TadG-related protein [Candidatus Margulisiibacteriota bacterium]|jgi:hypothetical protein